MTVSNFKLKNVWQRGAVLAALCGGLAAQGAWAGTIDWVVSFDIVGDDHVELTFKTDDVLHATSTPASFSGYLIDYTTVAGTSGSHTVKGLAPNTFGFGGATPPGTLKNDNLFYGNAGVPYSNSHPVVSYAGLAYEELGSGTKYQLFTDVNGALKGYTGTTDGEITLRTVANLRTTIPCVPEPESYALASVGLAMMGVVWRRRNTAVRQA